MLVIEREFNIPKDSCNESSIGFFQNKLAEHLADGEIPVRFVVTESMGDEYKCELGVLTDMGDFAPSEVKSIFEFVPRRFENTDKFNAVLLVPTGIGAEIGGHAGDAGPVAKLIASACDAMITHPNVVNASDINELPENGLYVEGSVISNMLLGTVGLQKVRSNRVLLIIDKHKEEQIAEFAINTVSGGRAAFGLDAPLVVEMEDPIVMRARYSTSGCAVGRVEGLERLYEVLERYKGDYDAVALASVVDVPKDFHMEYFKSHGEMVNPWGGVEAMLTHAVTMLHGIPSAHSPMMESMEVLGLQVGIVDPRMAAEAVSTSFLHCVLKGLHRSPRIINDRSAFGQSGVLNAADVACLIIPNGCVGLPTLAALEQGIPVIAVRENHNRMKNDLEKLPFKPGKLFIVENYLEAVGIMTALKAGVHPSTVRRPLADTKVLCERVKTVNDQVNIQSKPRSTRPSPLGLSNS